MPKGGNQAKPKPTQLTPPVPFTALTLDAAPLVLPPAPPAPSAETVTASSGLQNLVSAQTEFAQKAFEDGTAFMKKLAAVRSVETLVEIQTAYAKSAFEGFVAHATKMSELYKVLAKDSAKPFTDMVGKSTTTH